MTFFEAMFCPETFHRNVTGKLLFDILNEKLFSLVNIKKLAGVCTYGANVMTGKNEHFIGQSKNHGMPVHTFHSFHCIIH